MPYVLYQIVPITMISLRTVDTRDSMVTAMRSFNNMGAIRMNAEHYICREHSSASWAALVA